MCWFVIDPRTGKHLKQVDKPAPSGKQKLYLHNLAFDSFFDTAYAFEKFLAPHPRPSFDDLVAFVADGVVPKSLRRLVGPKLTKHRKAIQAFWAICDKDKKDGYEVVLGRPMLRQEKYWLVHDWLRRLSIGREQFYAGKTVRREEWLVDYRGWNGQRWKRRSRGRLRVFSDGSADAWYPSVGVVAFDSKADARRELEGAGFMRWEDIIAWPHFEDAPDPPSPPISTPEKPNEPFRYKGKY